MVLMTGDDLRKARLSLGLTQDELARELNIALRTLQGWENENAIPKAKQEFIRYKIQQLSEGSNVAVDFPSDEAVSIPADVWKVIQKLSISVKEKDKQISELIKIIRENIYGSKSTEQDS